MPRVVDQDEKRATIARAAYEVITSRGIGGATMREIARQAGCTTGMVVHYFRNKREVLLSAHDHAAQDVRRRMRAHEQNLGGLKLLLTLLDEVLPMDERRIGNWRIWMSFWDESVADPEVRGEQSNRVGEWHRRLRRALQQAMDAGEVPQCINVADEVDAIASLVEGLAILVIVHGRSIRPSRQRRLVGQYLDRMSLITA